MSLRVYNRKRKFNQTPEPRGKKSHSKGNLRFVVQMHEASRLHFDFRLEFDGYTPEALKELASKVDQWKQKVNDIFVYFDTEEKEYSPFDAENLAKKVL